MALGDTIDTGGNYTQPDDPWNSTKPDDYPGTATWDWETGDWAVNPANPNAPKPPVSLVPPRPGDKPNGNPSGQPTSGYNDQRPGLPNLADFRSPDPLRPWEEQFTAPTAQESINSPGFQFRLGEGLKALQRSSAAKGTLLTGGTMKALNNYAQNQATTQYQQDYNNAFNTYDTRRQNFLTNEANRYNSQRGNLNDQWGINSDYFNMGRANRQDDFNVFDTNRNFNFNAGNTNRNFSHMLDQDYFTNGLNLALLGKPPAPQLG